MILDQEVVIPASVDRVWDFMMDIPAVSRCVPGVESFEAIDPDTYQGALKVKVGPSGVTLQGKVKVAERDRENLRSRLEVSAAEKRIASTVNAKATMTLCPSPSRRTPLRMSKRLELAVFREQPLSSQHVRNGTCLHILRKA